MCKEASEWEGVISGELLVKSSSTLLAREGGMFRPPAERGHLETEGRDACDPWQRGMEFCVGHDTWEAMFGRVDGRWNFHSK